MFIQVHQNQYLSLRRIQINNIFILTALFKNVNVIQKFRFTNKELFN